MGKASFDAVTGKLFWLTLLLAPAIYLAPKALPTSSDSTGAVLFVLWTQLCVWAALSYCKEASLSALLEAAQKTTNRDGGS